MIDLELIGRIINVSKLNTQNLKLIAWKNRFPLQLFFEKKELRMNFFLEMNNSGKNKILKVCLTQFDLYRDLLWKLAKLFISTKIQLAQCIIESDSVND